MSYQPKFKIGDIIQDSSDRDYKFRVIKIAQKGEQVSGQWYDSTKNKTMPCETYILEGYRSKLIFMMSFGQECFYELADECKEKQFFRYCPKDYPDKCPHCKAPAYIGMNSVDCSAKCPASSNI